VQYDNDHVDIVLDPDTDPADPADPKTRIARTLSAECLSSVEDFTSLSKHWNDVMLV
jgi:hypothetical protein